MFEEPSGEKITFVFCSSFSFFFFVLFSPPPLTHNSSKDMAATHSSSPKKTKTQHMSAHTKRQQDQTLPKILSIGPTPCKREPFGSCEGHCLFGEELFANMVLSILTMLLPFAPISFLELISLNI